MKFSHTLNLILFRGQKCKIPYFLLSDDKGTFPVSEKKRLRLYAASHISIETVSETFKHSLIRAFRLQTQAQQIPNYWWSRPEAIKILQDTVVSRILMIFVLYPQRYPENIIFASDVTE